MKDYYCLAVQAVKSIIGEYGWNREALRSMAWGEGYPSTLDEVSGLVHVAHSSALVSVLVLFIRAGMRESECALAIYDAACAAKACFEKEGE